MKVTCFSKPESSLLLIGWVLRYYLKVIHKNYILMYVTLVVQTAYYLEHEMFPYGTQGD